MENAADALIIAGGVLISVLVITLTMYLISNFGVLVSNMNDEINQRQIVQFNTEYEIYESKEDTTIYDIFSIASKAAANNLKEEHIVKVYFESKQIDLYNEEQKINRIKQEINNSGTELPNYKCQINYSQDGFVNELTFSR